MVCGEELRSPRWRRKSETALPTTVLPGLFAVINFRIYISSSLRPWMMLLINSPQAIECQMRVHLGRRNICVAQDGLHRAQISAILHHMSGAGVAQHVRRGAAARSRGSGFHHLPDALARQLAGASRNEQQRRAFCADLPSGTTRSLSPLPRTSMYPASSFKSSSLALITSDTRSAPA